MCERQRKTALPHVAICRPVAEFLSQRAPSRLVDKKPTVRRDPDSQLLALSSGTSTRVGEGSLPDSTKQVMVEYELHCLPLKSEGNI